MCECVSSSPLSDLRNSARVLNKQIVDSQPDALLSACLSDQNTTLESPELQLTQVARHPVFFMIDEVTKGGEDVKCVFVRPCGRRRSLMNLLLRPGCACLKTSFRCVR